MMLIPSKQAKRFENAESCIAFEYDTKTPCINIARIEVSGRYPLAGTAINGEVQELVYVATGSGKVSVNGDIYPIQKGDVVSIEKGEAVYWEGTMTLVIACTPAWTAEQYTISP